MVPVQHRWLKSSNPILTRPQFERRGGQKTAARGPEPGAAVVSGRSGAGKEPARGYEEDSAPPPFVVGDLMTMDAVLFRAAAALAVTAAVAGLSWTVPPVSSCNTAASYGIAGAAGLAAAALVVVQRRRSRPSALPALVFAAVQGVFLGVLSNTVSSHFSPGALVQTVLGTMAASAATLLAHRMRWMRAGRRVRGLVGAALLGLCILALVDWLLFLLVGADGPGLRFSGLGVLMGVTGVVLGLSFLPLHLGQVEEGLTHGVSRDCSWPAAFGLTLTLSWLYVESARLFTLFPDDLY
ncbi:hypothetical protein C6Y14_12045 [Streptomyces dioscori]|uniref:Integral membrane protein n=1 Tax=Streptomyces dioscori TaxID=2109333 RepID=A0A2P8Q9J4_9ACTN|nr:Bax inhibitor-1/YccA family protein [Streptomyces dioscori]PSM42916.1 hypothetical protein C6Y14_12045 [Streptomyces dioscori]